jgi:hypothetical protein
MHLENSRAHHWNHDGSAVYLNGRSAASGIHRFEVLSRD